MRRVGPVLVALLVASSFVACGSEDDPAPSIKLDGSARVPDDAGIVDAVSVEEITIDGRERPLSKYLQSFSTYKLTVVPVLQSEGAYVHVGVTRGQVVWLAVVAKPLPKDGGGSAAFYTGTVVRTDEDGVVFQDGTVLDRASGLDEPVAGAVVLAEIDPETDRIVALTDA